MFDLMNSLTVNAEAVGDVVASPGLAKRTGTVYVNAIDGPSEIAIHGTPAEIADLGRKIVDAAEQLRSNLRERIIEQWNAEHPATSTKANLAGRCEGCLGLFPRLFATAVNTGPYNTDREILNLCAECAHVEPADAEALANAVRLTEDESPNDVRADLHDLGMDDDPVKRFLAETGLDKDLAS
jgi:hypothetical protein